jgi:DNA processing protein
MAQEIFIDDERYPKDLKKALENLIPSLRPKKLYYKGKWDEDIFENCLAVVGSRHLTTYGRRTAEQLVSQIAGAGITVVSGFMYGGDEAAHKTTVQVGGRTIAVMPCGIDRIHPEYQADLYDEIQRKNGLIISEYPADDQPQQWTYVQRDRIVAGLSKAVLVVEAGLKSGSLITASYAEKFGRKIFAVPGPITSEVSKGTNKLIKEGAEAVTCAEDILNFFKMSPVIARNKATKQSKQFDPLEQGIIDQLKREPMDADSIARSLNLPAAKIGTTLTLMQLKSIINQDSGKYYVN